MNEGDNNTPATPGSNFFTKMANTKPYFKAAFQGFAGTGKTYTSALVAAGLHKEIKSEKPIIIIDTEKSAKFLAPYFKEQSIEVLVKETRSLVDVVQAIKLAEGSAPGSGVSDIVIIDSISHIWEDFLEAYKAQKKRNRGTDRLEMLDWGTIKPTWKKQFSDLFVQSKCHIIMTGRAGYEYESEVNADTGKREIYKSGIKMKVEGETAYEPDMLVLMERFEEILTDKKEVYRQGTVLKDRTNIIDGKTFRDPGYEHFAPAIRFMIADPSADDALGEQANTGTLFDMSDDSRERKIARTKVLEEIEGVLTSYAPGSSAAEKKFKAEAINRAFGTYSWTAIEQQMPLEKLNTGLDEIMVIIQDAIKAKAEAEKEGKDSKEAVIEAAKGNKKKEETKA